MQDTACWWEVFHAHARPSLLVRGLAQSRRSLARNKPCKRTQEHHVVSLQTTMQTTCKMNRRVSRKWPYFLQAILFQDSAWTCKYPFHGNPISEKRKGTSSAEQRLSLAKYSSYCTFHPVYEWTHPRPLPHFFCWCRAYSMYVEYIQWICSVVHMIEWVSSSHFPSIQPMTPIFDIRVWLK